MKFDWHEAKDDEVRARRGLGFRDAVAIFGQRVVVASDERRDYGEVRMIAVGRAAGTFYTVVHTDRGDLRWIITAWPSSRKERAE